MKAWITKYALTQGIFEIEGDVSTANPDMIVQGFPKIAWGINARHYGKGRDWHETEDGAKARAEKMRLAALESLNKKMKKLRLMTF